MLLQALQSSDNVTHDLYHLSNCEDSDSLLHKA